MGRYRSNKEAEGIVLIIGVVIYFAYMIFNSIVNGVSSFFNNNGDEVTQFLIYLIVFGIPILLILLIVRFIIKRREGFVKSKSMILIKLDDLNLAFTFRKINTEYSYQDSHPNKGKFDRDNPRKFAERHMYSNLNYYLGLLDDIEQNTKGYSDYTERYNTLKTLLRKTNISEEKFNVIRFNKIEQKR